MGSTLHFRNKQNLCNLLLYSEAEYTLLRPTFSSGLNWPSTHSVNCCRSFLPFPRLPFDSRHFSREVELPIPFCCFVPRFQPFQSFLCSSYGADFSRLAYSTSSAQDSSLRLVQLVEQAGCRFLHFTGSVCVCASLPALFWNAGVPR